MLKQMISGVNTAWKGARRAVGSLGSLIQNTAKTVGKYTKENFVSAYQQGAKHTMPTKYQIADTENTPTKNIIRRLVDILFLPVFSSLPGWMTGLLIAPSLYYSYQNIISFFQLPLDLVYYDRKKKINLDWQGGPYGLLGAMVGFLLGTVVGLAALVWRTLEQTWHTTASLLTQLINWSVSDIKEDNAVLKPKIQVKQYHHADRTDFEKGLGLYVIGWATTLVAGAGVLSAVGVGRFVVNTAVSAWRGLAYGVNLAVSDMLIFTKASEAPNNGALNAETYTLIPLKKEYRNAYQRYFFGAIGTLAINPALSIVGFTTVFTARVLINSIDSFTRTTAKTARVFLQNTFADKAFDLGNDPRDNRDRYGYSKSLGYPGQYLLGIPAIVLGAGIGIGSRFTIETYISFINTARDSFNLALQSVPSYHPFRPLKKQRANYERAVGFLGYFLGVVIPSPVTLSIVLGRTLITNFITAKNFTRFFLQEHSTLHGAIEVHAVNDDEEKVIDFHNNPMRANIIGEQQKPMLTRFSSWIKKVNSMNGADERPLWLQVFSIPGIMIGSLLGGGLRAIVETTLTSIDTISQISNLALYKSRFANQFALIKPNRNTLERNLGVFGYILGGAIGIVPFVAIGTARWLITNGDSARRAFITTVNAMHADNDRRRLEEPEEDTRPFIVKASSVLGYMTGGALGLSREFGLNTIRSFGRQIHYYGKAALFESPLDSKIADIDEDTRTLSQKRLGYLGLVTGTGFGWIAHGSITLSRIIGNSVISAYHTVRDMIEMAFLDEYPTTDTFTETRRIKAFLARSSSQREEVLNGYVSLSGEYRSNSFESEENDDDDAYRDENIEPVETHSANGNDPVFNSQRREDHRKNRPFALGTPGFILGGILGVGAFIIAGSGRIALNSFFTAWNITLNFADEILPEHISTHNVRVHQKPVPKLMGLPLGTLLGVLITGPLAWSAVFMYRLTVNSAITSFLFAEIITTLPPISNSIKWYQDARKGVDKRFGFVGFVFGGFAFSIAFGAVGYVVNMALHTVYHSAISGFRTFMYEIMWTSGSRKHTLIVGVDQSQLETILGQDKRTSFQRHGFGLVGDVVGAILGAPASAVIAIGRLVFLNAKLFAMGFMQAANLTLEKPFSDRQMALLDKSVNRLSWGQKPITLSRENLARLKYSFGAVGFTAGSLIGTVFVAVPVGFYRIAKESARSYYHLSQSLLNVGIEEPYFKNGVATDQRSGKMKAIGGLGYLLALTTAGLVPVANGVIKLIAVGLAFSLSGLTASYKIFLMQYYPRFKPINGNNDAIETDKKLRTLVSNLEHGELPSQQFIESPQGETGRKGAYDFIEKSLCFNETRLSESILYAKVRKNQKGESISLTSDELDEIKNKHHGLFFFSQEERKEYDHAVNKRCNKVDAFVNQYVNGKVQTTPENEEYKLSAEALFNFKP